MSTVARLVLALILALGVVAPGTHAAHAQDDEGYQDAPGYQDDPAYPDDQGDDGGGYDQAQYAGDPAPDPAGYGPALAPYGSWVDDGRYGQVWEPTVSVGWAPYTDGSWAWTPAGWTWVSSEPWSWTFHYGRWALDDGGGWAWLPGTVWGPAWVDWYWGDGFVGWAPLGPFGTHVTVINQFVFVHDRDFCSGNLGRVVVDHHLVPDRVVQHWQNRDWTNDRPPGRQHIEQVSNHPIMRMNRRPPGTLAPRGLGGRQMARPGGMPRLGGARQTETRLGTAWNPGQSPRVAPPALRAPAWPGSPRQTPPQPGLARRDPFPSNGWSAARVPFRRPSAPPVAAMRPAPPAMPRASVGLPTPGLTGQRRLGGGRAVGARGERSGTGGSLAFTPGAFGKR